MPNEQANLIWIDCEMTGLSLEKDVLVEIAVLVTDSDFTWSGLTDGDVDNFQFFRTAMAVNAYSTAHVSGSSGGWGSRLVAASCHTTDVRACHFGLENLH